MVLDLYVKVYDDFLDQVKLAPQLIELRFEDLEANPMEHLHELYEELAIPGFEEASLKFEQYLAGQKDYKKNTYYIKQIEVDTINKKWGKYIEKWGYELPENMKIV